MMMRRVAVALAVAAWAMGSLRAADRFDLDGAKLDFQISCSTFGSSNRVGRAVTAGDMDAMSVARDANVTTVTWRGCHPFGPDFRVTATLERTGEGAWEYALAFAGNTNAIPMREVRFPILTVSRTDATEVLVPQHNGLLLTPEWNTLKPGAKLNETRPFEIHFAATLDRTIPGWMVDQRGDARLESTKLIALNGTAPSTATLVSAWVSPAVVAAAGELPYRGEIRRLAPGTGWYGAAMAYGRWARRQPWYRAARARDLSRLRNIAFWFWNRGAAEKVISPVERFARDAGVPCALDWYWWHDIPYDSYFPDFWPPREGEQTFREAVARCRRNGIFLQVYTNGATWDLDGDTWQEGGEAGVLRLIDGTRKAHAFNVFNDHRLAWMCGTAQAFQDRLCGVYRHLADAGLPGIYMDMIGCSSYDDCYATNHRHIPGGGRAAVEGYRAFARRVRQENPNVLLSTEEPTEAYLEVFDSCISLYTNAERFGTGNDRRRYVPAHHAIYHGCAALFGSFAMVHGIPAFDEKWPKERKWKTERDWKALFPDQFAVETARGVVWGMQPMVHNFLPENATDPKYADDYKLMIDTARFYYANRDLLFDGEMLDPGTMTCDAGACDFLKRGTYAREGSYATIRRTNLETVLHSVWRAPGGRTAAVLFNWTRAPRTYALKTPDIEAAGTLPPRTWRVVEAKAKPVPEKIIFDTDMLTDFDDVGALACLHALADAGECEILATVSCTRGNASVGAVQVINGYYGRPDIPVGCAKEIGIVGACARKNGKKIDPKSPLVSPTTNKWADGGHYKYRKLVADYPQWVTYPDSDDAPDANEVYRKALAAAPDGSVTICSVGFITNIRRLLETKGDRYSPLDGKALVAKKVKRWVAMACQYPNGCEYNSMWDEESSRIAFEQWPTPVWFSDYVYGRDVFAGRAIAEAGGPRNPVKDVFAGNIPARAAIRKDPAGELRRCFGMGGRSAWDETAVLLAVRGFEPYFNAERGRYSMVGTTNANEWAPDADGPHLRITSKMSKADVGRVIDELICRGPRKNGR